MLYVHKFKNSKIKYCLRILASTDSLPFVLRKKRVKLNRLLKIDRELTFGHILVGTFIFESGYIFSGIDQSAYYQGEFIGK